MSIVYEGILERFAIDKIQFHMAQNYEESNRYLIALEFMHCLKWQLDF